MAYTAGLIIDPSGSGTPWVDSSSPDAWPAPTNCSTKRSLGAKAVDEAKSRSIGNQNDEG
jgi:hypothetical protein